VGGDHLSPAPPRLAPSALLTGRPVSDSTATIGRRFERQATRHGARPALRSRGVSTSYRDLNLAANRIAHVLLARRVDRRAPVAIHTYEIEAAVASILGTLKTGGVCVPLDAASPAARQAVVLEQAGAAVLLTTRAHAALAHRLAGDRCRVVVVDDLEGSLDESDPMGEVSPVDIACLMFTSGSTGTPKGVIHDHLTLTAPTDHWAELFSFGERDRFVHLAPLSNISGVNDMLKPLLHGGCMIPLFLPEASPGRLASLVIKERISVYHSVPSVFRAMASALPAGANLEALRLVHLGGEPMFRSDLELFRKNFPHGCTLVNNLGSTEVPSFIQHVIDPDAAPEDPIVPVGFPVPGRRIRLLDTEGAEVADGEIGEIEVRSSFVARGYWNDPEATAARFAGDLTGRGERTLRTGDLARRRPDGALDFLGRHDDQIKVRGHRVELAEVQFALMEAAREGGGFGESVVVPGPLPSGATGLVAYVTPAGVGAARLDRLRSRMADRLPPAMRPDAYVPLDAIPRTSTGKVDRPALPLAGRPAAPREGGPRAGSVPERQLEELWRQLLGVERIGVEDDFFELGGDSLLAFRLAHDVERVFGRPVSLPELANASTLGAMTRMIEDGSRARTAPCLVPLQPRGGKAPLFLVHGLGGSVIQMRPLARALDADRPVYGFQARGIDGVSRPLPRIELMATAYLRELRRVRPEGPILLGGYSMGGVVAYEMARRLAGEGARVAALVLIDAGAPVPLAWTERLAHSFAYGRLMMRQWRRRGVRLPRGGYARRVNRTMLVNFRAVRRYRPGPYHGEVHLVASRPGDLAAAADARDTHLVERLEQRLVLRRDRWRDLVPRGLVVHEVAGHHLELFRPPAVDGLRTTLRAIVDAACGD